MSRFGVDDLRACKYLVWWRVRLTGPQVLKSAMKARGWDENDLSERSGVHVTLIRRYFGKYTDRAVRIGPKNAERLAKALGISPGSLLYGSRTA